MRLWPPAPPPARPVRASSHVPPRACIAPAPTRPHASSPRSPAAGETFVADVTNADLLKSIIEGYDARHPLDLVLANAGVAESTIGAMYDVEKAGRVITAVNVVGVVNTVLPAIAVMRPRGRGQVALVSSQSAFLTYWPQAPTYAGASVARAPWCAHAAARAKRPLLCIALPPPHPTQLAHPSHVLRLRLRLQRPRRTSRAGAWACAPTSGALASRSTSWRPISSTRRWSRPSPSSRRSSMCVWGVACGGTPALAGPCRSAAWLRRQRECGTALLCAFDGVLLSTCVQPPGFATDRLTGCVACCRQR